MPSYLQGLFNPAHPEKYKGDVKQIVYRSSWELSYMMKLDDDPDVIEWSSESVIIPYKYPVPPFPLRRYFADFWVKKKVGNQVKCFVIEIKPKQQTKPPQNSGKKKGKTMLKEQLTYAVNMSKWAAADKYCQMKGWEFIILSEKDLGR